MKIFSVYPLIVMLWSLTAHGFDSDAVAADMTKFDKELNALLSVQYAHEDVELDKMKATPGYVANVLRPELKASITRLIEQIITYQETVMAGVDDNQRCLAAIVSYKAGGLAVLQTGLKEYLELSVPMMSGVQLMDMHYRRAYSDFLTGPILECRS